MEVSIFSSGTLHLKEKFYEQSTFTDRTGQKKADICVVPACLAVEIAPRVGQVWQQAEVAPVRVQQLHRGGGSVPPGHQHHCEVVTSS